jgi:hypothetical protein
MQNAVAHTERALAEYSRMQSDLAAMTNERDEYQRDNELLRAEVSRTNQRLEEIKSDYEGRIATLTEDRDVYLRFSTTMTTKLGMVDKVMNGVVSLLSKSIQDAVEASKDVAFNKPTLVASTEPPEHEEDAGLAAIGRELAPELKTGTGR